MKKRTKRAVSMVLAAGMIASLVVGASADEGFHESGLPITDEPVTLTVLTTRWGNMGDSFTANKFLTDLGRKQQRAYRVAGTVSERLERAEGHHAGQWRTSGYYHGFPYI